jgi:hypothetical protein
LRRLNTRSRWQQPAQAQLNQQHQHKGLASIRRQLGLPAGYSVWVFRGRRLDLDAGPATLRNCAGFAGSTPKRHRPHSAIVRALNFCLIKHLHDRAGEKHYRCEAKPRGS